MTAVCKDDFRWLTHAPDAAIMVPIQVEGQSPSGSNYYLIKGKPTVLIGNVAQGNEPHLTFGADIWNYFTHTLDMKFKVWSDAADANPIYLSPETWTVNAGGENIPCNSVGITTIEITLPVGLFKFTREGLVDLHEGFVDASGASFAFGDPTNHEKTVPSNNIISSLALHVIFERVRIRGDPELTVDEARDTVVNSVHLLGAAFPVSGQDQVRNYFFLDDYPFDNSTGELRYPDFIRSLTLDRIACKGGEKCVVIGLVKGDQIGNIGWLNKHIGVDANGLSFVGSKVAFATVGWYTTVVHEILHLLCCPNNHEDLAYGYNVVDGKDRWGVRNFLGTGAWEDFKNVDAPEWTADNDYVGLLLALGRGGPFSASKDPEGLFVRASIYDNGTVTLDPWYRTSDSTLDGFTNPQYQLVYKAVNGSILGSVGFNSTTQGTDNVTVSLNPATVAFWAPWYNGTSQILMENSQGTVIASRQVYAVGPSLNIQSPTPGSRVGSGSVNIVWSGASPSGAPLTYAVLISNDSGVSWGPISVDTTASSLSLQSGLISGQTYNLRVLASDGVNTVEAQTYFTYGGQALLTLTPPILYLGSLPLALLVELRLRKATRPRIRHQAVLSQT